MRYLYDAWGNPISFHYDDATENVTLRTRQDCEPIIEHNKKLATHNDGYSPSREIRRKASIPLNLVNTWLDEDGISKVAFWAWPGREQRAYCAKRYQSSEWMHLRTA